jgi:predicted enzyme related to lactoylglutathione lyase
MRNMPDQARGGADHNHYTKGGRKMDWKLELVPIPVSDVDRAKAFYAEKVGFNVDLDVSAETDQRVTDERRVVQLTPPGSACSIAFGIGILDTPPGSVQALHLVVSDIEAARAELVDRGVEVGEVQDLGGVLYAPFSDPDGNGWTLQQLPY